MSTPFQPHLLNFLINVGKLKKGTKNEMITEIIRIIHLSNATSKSTSSDTSAHHVIIKKLKTHHDITIQVTDVCNYVKLLLNIMLRCNLLLAWLDMLTPKQVLLMSAIAEKLSRKGFDIIFTSRKYDYVTTLIEKKGLKVLFFGEHGGASLINKLVASTKRTYLIAEYFKENGIYPDLLVSLSSPEATRVGFGLGIPVLTLNDAPHAVAVGKLTFSMSSKLIVPSCIPREKYFTLGATDEKIVQYNGLDEVSYIKNFQPSNEVFDELGLDKNDDYIVARTEESKAAYMYNLTKPGATILDRIFEKIFAKYPEIKSIVFPRYEEQKRKLESKFGDRIIIPKKAVDSLSLMYHAKLVITGGGTMGREASLMGVPSISYFPLHLDIEEYLEKKGFPMHHLYKFDDVLSTMMTILDGKLPDRKKIARQMVDNMESPYKPIEKFLNKHFI